MSELLLCGDLQEMLQQEIPFDSDCVDLKLLDTAFHQALEQVDRRECNIIIVISQNSPLYDMEAVLGDGEVGLSTTGKGLTLPMLIQTGVEEAQAQVAIWKIN